jgi:hypothetical protein
MVKVSLTDAQFERLGSPATFCEWVTEILGPPTIKNMNGDEVLNTHDHHYYEGNDLWQYHFVRTTREPAADDRHLYLDKTEITGKDIEIKFLEATYLILPDDATALQMLLSLS